MTQQRLVFPTLFAALTLAAIAAGCSGGAGSTGGSLPAAPASTDRDAARHRTRVGAVLRIHIPPKPKHRKRRGKYVSPNTLALTVGVEDITVSPPTSLPLQTLVVNTPKPCIRATGDGGLTCTFAVRAYIGKNIFTFNEYATKNPTPQDTPLGTLVSGPQTITSGGSGISFELEGVVSRVALSVPSPESTFNPASEATEVLPIGAATSFPLSINPQDASGASIATSYFSQPITISVPSPNAGVTLALNKQCTGDTTSDVTVTLSCASDLNQVTVSYDGTVAQTGANAYLDSLKISASPQLASPSPQPATVALSSNLLAYQLVAAQGGTDPTIGSSNLALDPVNGQLVFAYTVNSSSPTFVRFDPAHPAATPSTAAIGFAPSFVIFDSAGQLWTNDITSPAVHCFSNISTLSGTIGVGDSRGAIDVPIIAPDGSGNIWYSGDDVAGYPAIGFFADSCSNGSNMAKFPLINADEQPVGLALALPVAGNAAVGMVTTDGPYNFYGVNSATAPVPTPTPLAAWPSGEFPQGLVNDKAFNIYGVSQGSTPVVNKIATGTANITSLANLPPSSYPVGVDQYSGTQSTAQALAVLDNGLGVNANGFAGTALVNPAASTTEPLEIVGNESTGCMGVSYDKTGGVWFVCYHGDGSIWAYHPIVTSTWSLLPSTLQYTNNYQTVLTVAEKTGVDDSPFTVTANSNPSVISVGASWPTFPHALPVSIDGTGTAILTIADKHGRTQSTSIVVTASGIVPTPGPRPVHPPHPRKHP